MNPNTAQVQAMLRLLLIYGVCAAMGIFLGVTVTNPLGAQTYEMLGLLLLLLSLPLLVHWHYPLLLFFWNCNAIAFFLKGSPGLSLAMIAISLGISIVQRTINPEMRFISAPQITWPILAFVAVMLVTAKLTGGIGLRSAGSQTYGGQKYVWVLLGLIGYFALAAHRIPPQHAKLYTALFFLGALTGAIGDVRWLAPRWAQYLLAFFPVGSSETEFGLGTVRLSGIAYAGQWAASGLMAIYGVRGLFLTGKLWRPCLFVFSCLLIFLGGFRSWLAAVAVMFVILFFVEGLYRTKMLPVFILVGLTLGCLAVPMARHLPYTFQRTLAFVPEGMLDLDREARMDAQGSSDWRFEMWKALLPEVPKHLLLGEGYAIKPEDYFTEMGAGAALGSVADPGQQALALSHDYHNVWFSLLLPLGIWGFLAYVWLLFAGLWAVYRNYRYGNSELRTINGFLFAYTLWNVVGFISFLAGVPPEHIGLLTGAFGLSVALNGGIRRPEREPAVMKMRVGQRVHRFPVPELQIPTPRKSRSLKGGHVTGDT